MRRVSAYNLKALMEGGLSLIPGGLQLFRKGTLGTDSARYCYSVWLRHRIKSSAYDPVAATGRVVELGPGDSLGIGLAALLSGTTEYVAVDAVRHASIARNLKILDELATLFAARIPIPASDEFPNVKPELPCYDFPRSLLKQGLLARSLTPERIAAIASTLSGNPDPAAAERLIHYVDPTAARDIIVPGSVDLVFSQAVLEHIDDLAGAYRACHHWLRPGGLMSHQIDFKSHGTSREWNGHWAYPDPLWRLLRGGRPYLINREPCSRHLQYLTQAGFELLSIERAQLTSRLQRNQLAQRFRAMGEDDLTTASVYILARKLTDGPYPARRDAPTSQPKGRHAKHDA